MKKNIKQIINIFKHLKKIFIHKYWVGLYQKYNMGKILVLGDIHGRTC